VAQHNVAYPLSPEDRARADVYLLLGALLAQAPDEEMLARLRGIEVPAASDQGAMPDAWRALRKAALEADTTSLEDEYHALFIGLGRGELVPYASSYLTGYLMERPLADLRSELARLGYARQDAVKEPEDHAAALCEVMGMIILDDGLSLDHQRGFFQTYLAPWIEQFFEDLGGAESSPFYCAVGRFGQVFISIDKECVSMLA